MDTESKSFIPKKKNEEEKKKAQQIGHHESTTFQQESHMFYPQVSQAQQAPFSQQISRYEQPIFHDLQTFNPQTSYLNKPYSPQAFYDPQISTQHQQLPQQETQMFQISHTQQQQQYMYPPQETFTSYQSQAPTQFATPHYISQLSQQQQLQGEFKQVQMLNQAFKKPKRSTIAAPVTTSPIQLVTNSFRIRNLNSSSIIYTYSVDFLRDDSVSKESQLVNKLSRLGVDEEEKSYPKEQLRATVEVATTNLETFQKLMLMKTLTTQLKTIFSLYIFVGGNLFSTTLLEEGQIFLQTTKPFLGYHYKVIITRVSEFIFENIRSSHMKSHPFSLTFVNCIIKAALRSQNMIQLGRSAQFFSPNQNATNTVVEVWSGYFTSSWAYEKGLYLVIDNVSKFLSRQNCLEIILDRLNKRAD